MKVVQNCSALDSTILILPPIVSVYVYVWEGEMRVILNANIHTVGSVGKKGFYIEKLVDGFFFLRAQC